MKILNAAVIWTLITVAYSDQFNLTLLTSKIIDGKDVVQGTYTFIGYLKRNDWYICTGAFVSVSRFITAASHVKDLKPPHYRDTKVVFGSVSMGKGGTVRSIRKIQVHRLYRCRENAIPAHNIATVDMWGRIDSSASWINLSGRVLSEPVEALVAGWGSTNVSRYLWTDKLKKLTVRTITSSDCARIFNQRLPLSTICAIPQNEQMYALSAGDEGDPLFTAEGELIGIASYVPMPPSLPNAYTAIKSYTKFIRKPLSSIISEESDSDSDFWDYRKD